MRRSLINLGDYVRATEDLGADEDESRTIAALLGLELAEKEPEARGQGSSAPAATSDAPEEKPPAPRAPATPSALPEGVPNEAWVETLEPQPYYKPPWFGEVKSLPRWVGGRAVAPRPDTLFRPEWVRTLLSLALSAVDDYGPVDWELTAEQLSRNEPLTHLPRLPRLRLADSVQVLVDVNQSMRPFAQDQSNVLADIGRVIPAQKISELYFSVCPTRGVGRSLAVFSETYRPPPRTTPVLLLTDLGASQTDYSVEHPLPGEWRQFVEVVRKSGCPLVALVPYPRLRIPPQLRQDMCVVTWDRATTAGQVQRLRQDSESRREQ